MSVYFTPRSHKAPAAFLDNPQVPAHEKIGTAFTLALKALSRNDLKKLHGWMEYLGIDSSDRDAQFAATSLLRKLNDGSLRVVPTETTGLFYVQKPTDSNKKDVFKNVAVFKIGHKRAAMETTARFLAKELGLGRCITPGMFCAVSNPPLFDSPPGTLERFEVVEELWNGLEKVFLPPSAPPVKPVPVRKNEIDDDLFGPRTETDEKQDSSIEFERGTQSDKDDSGEKSDSSPLFIRRPLVPSSGSSSSHSSSAPKSSRSYSTSPSMPIQSQTRSPTNYNDSVFLTESPPSDSDTTSLLGSKPSRKASYLSTNRAAFPFSPSSSHVQGEKSSPVQSRGAKSSSLDDGDLFAFSLPSATLSFPGSSSRATNSISRGQTPTKDDDDSSSETTPRSDAEHAQKTASAVVGIIQPFLSDRKTASTYEFTVMTMLALAIGLRDGKKDGYIGNQFLDVEDCFGDWIDPPWTPGKIEKYPSAIDLPYLDQDPRTTTQLTSLEVGQLGVLVENWNIAEVIHNLRERKIRYYDQVTEVGKVGARGLDSGSNSYKLMKARSEPIHGTFNPLNPANTEFHMLSPEQLDACNTRLTRIRDFIQDRARQELTFTPQNLVHAVDPWGQIYERAILTSPLPRQTEQILRASGTNHITGRWAPKEIKVSIPPETYSDKSSSGTDSPTVSEEQ